jgi:hypothetical protein
VSRFRTAIGALAAFIGAALASGQGSVPTPPPPCLDVKGRVVSVDPAGRTVTLARTSGPQTLQVSAAAAAQVRTLKPGSQVTLDLTCTPPIVVTRILARTDDAPGPSPSSRPTAAASNVLVLSDQACALQVDLKPAGKVEAGASLELRLPPGERVFTATTADGRKWQKTVKVGAEQVVVQVELGAPVTSEAEFDASAGRLYKALLELKRAGASVDAVLASKKFKFHEADTAAIASAVAIWARELAAVRAMTLSPSRASVRADLERLDADTRAYAELLEQALQKAQERNSVMGEPQTLRSRAAAIAPLLRLDGPSWQTLKASAAFRGALPGERLE